MRIIGSFMVLVCGLMLTGCSPTELEERTFPLVVVVDYEEDTRQTIFYAGLPKVETAGKEMTSQEVQVKPVAGASFSESKKTFEENLNKDPDYNHLKVLVLGEDLVEQEEAYNKMLESMVSPEEFPRNTYVCIVDDVDDLLKIEEKLPQDLGTYLEEFLNHHEEDVQRMITLGDLLDEKENQKLTLYVPYLDPEDSYVEWNGCYAVRENHSR